MNNTQTDDNIIDEEAVKVIEGQLNDLIKEVDEINTEIEQNSTESKKSLDELEEQIDKSILGVEKTFAELDTFEKDIDAEIDELVLDQAQNIDTE